MCVINLPKVVTWRCPGLESNLQPLDYKFGTLPLHPKATPVEQKTEVVVLEFTDYQWQGQGGQMPISAAEF